MFLHSPKSVLHILFNMLALWSVGPVLEKMMGHWPFLALYVLSGSLAALLLTDTVISTTVLGRIRKNTSLSEKDDTEAITKSVRETLARDSALVRRTLRAFPYAKLYNGKALEKARAARAKLKADLKQAQLKARADIDAREEELRLAVKERKAMVKAKKEELRAKRKKEA